MRPVVPGQGPSSKVSTTSFGASRRVWGNCLRPTRGEVTASTSSTRAVPSPSALPGQGAPIAAVPIAAAHNAAKIAAADLMIVNMPGDVAQDGNDGEQL